MTSELNYAGSRWWKFDFHCHTPASDDYGKGSDQESIKKIDPQSWLLNYMRAEIDCVAITDHNSGEWIDQLKEAYLELKGQSNPEFRPIYIFPGVEISANGGVHILAILPEEKGGSHIASLLGAVGFTGEHGKCDTCTDKAANEVIQEIFKSGGIAIPAHVDDPKGIFKDFSGQTLEKILQIDEITAIELINKSYSKPELYKTNRINWSEVIGSDSHHPCKSSSSDDKYPGSHFTWVKMSIPTFEGLRLALLDGNYLSIKRSDDYSEDPNYFEHLFIESITVDEAHYMGNGHSFECKFSPWLNTIIGGRGIGKSTIIEFLRLCLQRRDQIPDPLWSDLEKYCKRFEKRGDDGLIKKETKIEVIIRKDRVRYKIVWDNEHQSGQIYSESEAGKWTESEGNIKQRFPINLFSQKQIFIFAKNNKNLLKFIDESPEVDYNGWEKNFNQMISHFLLICEKIREKESEINEEATLNGRLEDIDNKIKILEDSDHLSKLKQYETAQKKKEAIKEWKENWILSKDQLNQANTLLTLKELEKSIFELDYDFLRFVNETVSDIKTIQENIIGIIKGIDHLNDSWDAYCEKSKLKSEISLAIFEYNQLMQDLEKEGISDLSEYKELIRVRKEIKSQLDTIKKARTDIEELKESGKKCFNNMKAHRERITQKRIELLGDVLSENKHISIKVIPYGDIEGIEPALREIIGKETSFDNDFDELVRLANDSAPNYIEGVNNIRRRIHDISKGKIQAKHKKFAEHFSTSDTQIIDRLWCYYPEDALDIKYYDENKCDFVPIKEGSPGQKTAAILAFIMTYGNDPLILDQPEDDLDNKLIYNLIVSQITSVKKSRQIIIVTHNANIVVNGDSENVIPLISRSGQTAIKGYGGLQEREIRKELCEILEGGEKAFKMRYKRVNI